MVSHQGTRVRGFLNIIQFIVAIVQCRPTILTLTSIFATFRVLRSNAEMANAFLVVGDALGMPRKQIVFDVLRAGFLTQLEASKSQTSGENVGGDACTSASAENHQPEREALADMFVYLRLDAICLFMH